MVRFAEEKDLDFLKYIWDICFHDPKEFIDWNFDRNFSYENTLIAEVDGKPASCMQLMPHRILLRNKIYPVNYISGVATLPEYRHKGLVREMFAFAFPQMEKRGEPISLLVPFNYPFYEKFGYKQCYEKTFRYTKQLPKKGLCTGEDLSPDLIDRLDIIYQKAMVQKTGYALRSKEDWQKILEDLLIISKGKIFFHQTDGLEDGYALISSHPKEGFELHEVLGVCDLDFRSEVKPFAMARVLDIQGLLFDWVTDFHGCWRIKIVDENIPKNNLTLCLTHGSVEPCTEYDTEIDIRYLTQLLFGFSGDFPHVFSKTDTYLNMIF